MTISRKHISDREPGDLNAYREGCRCYPCSDAWAAYHKRQMRSDWKPFVPAGPVRDHLAHLAANGIGAARVATLANTERSTVRRIRGTAGYKQSSRVRTEIAERILAIRPALELLGDGVYIDGTGTYRRLRALSALGFPATYLSRRLGAHHKRVHLFEPTPYVRAWYARAVRRLYDELSLTTPEQVDRLGLRPASVTNARNRAATLGWPRPLEWDDDLIDDPDATAQRGEWTAPPARTVADGEVEDAMWIVQTEHPDVTSELAREHAARRLGVPVHRLEYILAKAAERGERIGVAA